MATVSGVREGFSEQGPQSCDSKEKEKPTKETAVQRPRGGNYGGPGDLLAVVAGAEWTPGAVG